MKTKIHYIGMICFALLLLSGCQASGTDGSAAVSETEVQEAQAPALVLENFRTSSGALDVSALQQYNSACYGWLVIEDTDMSFPLLHTGAGDTTWLTHDFFGEEDESGSIYTEDMNALDFSDHNTVIYGRNASGKFAGLHQYQEREFFDEHRDITVYLDGRVLKYRIFAAYTYNDRHLLYSYDFTDKNTFSVYLGEVLAQRQMDAFIDDSADVTADDRILTLSTGVTDQPEKRYLVQAVLEE